MIMNIRLSVAAPRAWMATLALLLLGACAQQRIHDQAYERARGGDYEKATQLIDAGLAAHPDSALLRSSSLQLRNEALSRLIAEAASARASGRFDDAHAALERAARFDANGQRTRSLLADLAVEVRQREALQRASELVAGKQVDAALKVIADALKDNRRQPDLLALQRQLEARMRQQQTRGRIVLAEQRPISLDFRDAGLRTVLDVVTRHSGVNFILDKDIRTDVRVSVYLRSARLEDAIDLIASTHGLAKKVVDERTILVYPNTTDKQREYQEQVIRVFYLASADAKGAAAFLRSMIRLREPFVDERANLIAIRESPENVELAERLVALYDTQEPEVLLELEVIEMRTSRLLDLGIKLPDTLSLSLIPPVGGLTLGNFRDSLTRNNVAVGVGGAILNFKREVGDFTTLANPRIRVKNKEKARVLIGDKVPVITTTTGTGGFVGDSVNYLDVGLKLDVEPTVYADDEVAIRVALEVSSVAREVRTGSGTLAYQVGTRNASTMLRLRDGETQLLAGLISNEDRSSASRVPGLGDLPLAGRLFSAQRDDSNRTELVLAITPRILRNLRQPDASEAELWIGTEANTRLRPPGGRPINVDAPESGNSASGAPLAAAQVGAVQRGGAAGAPLAPAALQLSWRAPKEVKVGETFIVGVDLNSGFALRGAPLRLSFDKDRLSLAEVQEGDYFKQGQVTTSFTQNVDSASGRADFGILRAPMSGTPGQGSVVNLSFRATMAGTAELSIRGFDPVLIGDGNPQPALPSALKIEVKP
jgi:general secretion pathway protein D